ncbi:uncharacterized protein PV07_07685 [Cladophialophora immunda]|uniref:Uncharacterized protein n=1 Tax=Cladophialophora immunda TaxID=569365 RepID=A0A0D2CAC3_9EURO|nr:uncharacterized protein PV07_07685 [Cladophialophora immunda]KIW27993.1 hypothetical protein PV07_07685 [Cladophialophora immunda]
MVVCSFPSALLAPKTRDIVNLVALNHQGRRHNSDASNYTNRWRRDHGMSTHRHPYPTKVAVEEGNTLPGAWPGWKLPLSTSAGHSMGRKGRRFYPIVCGSLSISIFRLFAGRARDYTPPSLQRYMEQDDTDTRDGHTGVIASTGEKSQSFASTQPGHAGLVSPTFVQGGALSSEREHFMLQE